MSALHNLEIKPLTLGQAFATDWPEPEYILGPLQEGDVGLLSGADGVGKSWAALGAALSVAHGKPMLGGMWDVPERPRQSLGGEGDRVLYVAIEDRRRDHGSRLQKVLKHAQERAEMSPPNVEDDGVTLWPMEGKRLALVRPTQSKTGGDRYEVTELGRDFAERIKGYRMVIIDPLRAFHDCDEADGAGMDFLVRWLVSVAMTNCQTILCVHHASQAAILNARDDHHAGRGATDFPAGCRGVWTLRGATEEEAEKHGIDRREWRVLVNGKASHGPESRNVYLQRQAGGVLARMELPEKFENDKQGTAKPTSRGKGNAYLAARDGVAICGSDDDFDY